MIIKFKALRSLFLLLGLFLFVTVTTGQNIPVPKNIIFFISDGMGYNHVDATSYYQYGDSGAQIYESPEWVKLAMATYPAVVAIDNGDTVFAAGYNPRMAKTDHTYVKSDYTGSAAAATAMSTGKKVHARSIGLGLKGDTLHHISQSAKALGKSTGVVASVPFTHATPAAFAAHQEDRANYGKIAKYMLFDTKLDVIMGTGHPEFDNNGKPSKPDYHYVGCSKIWQKITANKGKTVFEVNDRAYRVKDATGDGNPDPWHFIQTREEFIKLSQGETPPRIFGVPQIYSTLQQARDRKPGSKNPYDTPLIESVPTLEEMTRASLNLLSRNPNGFFVMIEGGAVDWAAHDNESDCLIEEQIDFNRSVEAAVEWIENNSSWDETLIIVTSDHECGYLTGPGDPDPLYPPVVNNGKGNLPGMQWNHDHHTNKLVPFYAKGPGAEIFKLFAGEYDPVRGPFIQNTTIPAVIFMMWDNGSF